MCVHVYCRGCVQDLLDFRQQQGLQAQCPICRKKIVARELMEVCTVHCLVHFAPVGSGRKLFA